MPTAIETSRLTHRYGDHLALDSLDLSIEAGSIYALLGPNGAGKTTLIGILTTLLQATEGSAQVAGIDVRKQPAEVRRHIGVTFQEIVLDKDLRGREVLDYHARLYGIGRAERQARIAELLKLVELEDAGDRLTKTYSGGMKRRLELARGLMTRPDVLFLDEPTQGLDPQNRALVWRYLRELRAGSGLTILLTTHYMEEAEALADRVGIIDHGRLVVEGSPAELSAGIGADMLRLSGKGDQERLRAALRALPFVTSANHAEGVTQVAVDQGKRRLVEIIGVAQSVDFEIEDLSVAQPGLADVFLKYTGHALRDE